MLTRGSINVAQRLVESRSGLVAGDQLQIDLQAAELRQRRFGKAHQPATQAGAALFGRNRHRVQPASMSVVTGHHRADDVLAECGHKKQAILHGHFFCDGQRRVIVCGVVAKGSAPELQSPARGRLRPGMGECRAFLRPVRFNKKSLVWASWQTISAPMRASTRCTITGASEIGSSLICDQRQQGCARMLSRRSIRRMHHRQRLTGAPAGRSGQIG
jgi:hypothetical protein